MTNKEMNTSDLASVTGEADGRLTLPLEWPLPSFRPIEL